MVNGNTAGIKASLLARLDALKELKVPGDLFVLPEILAVMAEATEMTGREIVVYITRGGEVCEVAVGNTADAKLADLRIRRNPGRLSHIRCLHTHPKGSPFLSDVDIQALRLMRFDAMAAMTVAGGVPEAVCVGLLGELPEGGPREVVQRGPFRAHSLPHEELLQDIREADARVIDDPDAPPQGRQRALLISMSDEDSLEELAALADTAGADVVFSALQKRSSIDPATLIGRGKAEELALARQAVGADLVICDEELTASQQRNLEEILGARVVDRGALILDIFAQRAKSHEGRLQVEVAQLSYMLPRLAGQGVALSRLGGGIGTRGPGETQLEMDRRRIRERLTDLNRELKDVKRQRQVRRAAREKNRVPVVALVGYTNSGKSTLLNKLSGSDVFAENRLFATLDTTARKLPLPGNRECVLVDTVGFIRKLPHELVDAFHATLEEALSADLLVVVSDAASPHCAQQRQVVGEVLAQLGAAGRPTIEALNKCDLVDAARDMQPGEVRVSAVTGEGLSMLLERISERIAGLNHTLRVRVPYAQGGILSLIHERGIVHSEEYREDHVLIEAELPAALCGKIEGQLGSEALAYSD